MQVITLAKCKELLGLQYDASYDDSITAKIPLIDAKVKQITRDRFNLMIIGDTTIDSPYVTVSSIYDDDLQYRHGEARWSYHGSGINNPYEIDTLVEYLETGMLISGDGIPSDSYIEEVYYNGVGNDEISIPTIKLSADATATASGVIIYLGINIAYQDIIAKGIQYLINTTNTTLPQNGISSKRMGPVSVSFSESDQRINNKYGMPSWFVKGLPKNLRGH